MEFMNYPIPDGLPPHYIYIVKSMGLMLLGSLSPKQGLCISTRIIHNKATNILLYCMIASGDYARQEVLITRIQIKRQDEKFIEWNRRQFPIKLAIAMTINQIHGKTLNNGILARGAYIHSWAAECCGL